MFLKDLGWNSYFDAIWQEFKDCGWAAARVVSQQRGLWRVAGDFAECWAAPSGKMREEADARGVWPAVGDWVGVEVGGDEERAILQHVLPRRSQFTRKVAGRRERTRLNSRHPVKSYARFCFKKKKNYSPTRIAETPVSGRER